MTTVPARMMRRGKLRSHQVAVGLRPAVAVERPALPNRLEKPHVEIATDYVGVVIRRRVTDETSLGVDEIGAAVEVVVAQWFDANAVDRPDEVLVGGGLGEAGYVAYTATKGGILAMSKAMAAELWQYRIRVNALCPGGVNTPLVENLFDITDDPAAARRESEESVLLGRFGMAEEIAQAALYLLSDESSYVTGSTLVVDGGRTQCLLNGSTQPPDNAARAGTAAGV